MIDREQFIQEQKLRRYVRKAINHVRTVRLQEQSEEDKLRGVIRRLISEAAVSEDPPHSNTGINALKHLLKNTNILKVLKDGYKALTTDADQRQSFRAHIVNGVQGILAPARSLDKIDAEGGAPGAEELAEALDLLDEQDIEVDVEGGDEEGDEAAAFIDVEADEGEEEEDKFGIPGKDVTGRNFAEDAFNQIEQPIMDKYEVLDNTEDQEMFYNYLLTNLKLYFDKWESELGEAEEPTTPEYEEEKGKQDELGGEGELGGEEELGGGEDLEDLGL